MRHRVFIAINLPEDIKKKLASYKEKWPDLPCRWIKKDNLHITLLFLGYVSDEEVLEVCKIVKEVVSKHASFNIVLAKIVYGPLKKPRMVWIEGEKNKELGILQSDLEKNFASYSVKNEKGRNYSPHITLGRLRQWEFNKIEQEERPEINEEINLTFFVESIEIMESQLKKGGAEYAILESVPFSQ